jgi:hypothetical protein
MPNSSILGGTRADINSAGRDVDALGPSDSSDSGSDIQGERSMPTDPDNPGELGALTVDGDNDSDASGTGERASATGDEGQGNSDILPNRVENDGTMQPDSTLDVPLQDLGDIAADDSGEDEDEDSDEDDDAPSPTERSASAPRPSRAAARRPAR